MKKFSQLLLIVLMALSLGFLSACQSTTVQNINSGKKTIVVTYSILGSLVQELVGDQANVLVSMPNGQDPHEWEPSAKDISALTHADLIVQNGLNLEGGMEKALAQAKEAGVKFFTASDYITVRHVGKGEGIPNGDSDQAIGAADPHIWMDPVAMKQVVDALTPTLKSELGIDVSANEKLLDAKLDSLNQEIAAEVNTIPAANRKLVSGHESLGYFAQRYGFQLIGAIIPSLNTQAEASASDMANLVKLIEANQVKAIFAEIGTPTNISETIGKETGVKVVELTTHMLPPKGDYFDFMQQLAQTIVNGLK